MKCCICNRKFDHKVKPKYLPFCGERCRLIDLGRWLNEDYGFFVLDEEGEEDADSLNEGIQ